MTAPRPPHERPAAADLALTVSPNQTRCPLCGGRRWVVHTEGNVQYRKCSSCGDKSKTFRGQSNGVPVEQDDG
jgi:tRNA(Ile2) C34 agmatinyltransferase TiaS